MKNVIITGATGMVGSLVLRECLDNNEVQTVTIIVRRSTGITHKKLLEVVHEDFTDYSDISGSFKNKDIAYYCIGIYTGQVSRDEFQKITVDFTKAFANMLKQQSPGATFCFLSGMGADRTERSRMMFAKDKGIAENFLLGKKFSQAYIFRPAYIYPVTPRKEPNFGYKLYRALYPVMKVLFPNGVIESTALAKAMFMAGIEGAEKTTLENKDIKRILPVK